MIQPIRFKSFKLLNPENVNVIENGYSLLDMIVEIFTQAIDKEEEYGKDYFLNGYLFFVNKLIIMGALLNKPPTYPTTLPMNQKFVNLIETLESVNPNYVSDDE